MGLYNHLDIANAGDLLTDRRLKTPKKVSCDDDWTLESLQEHLQWAVDIEHYTIPFYMSAMYSIKDQSAEARRLLRSIANQEMLHMQSAANIANAYGTDLVICAPSYGGSVPHLDFSLATPDPTKIFTPYSTDIGPLDVERINAMCIIEFPDWDDDDSDAPEDEYSSIGDFYDSVEQGCKVLQKHIKGNVRQVAHFSALYPEIPSLTVTEDGHEGFKQVKTLIDLIVDQGEGKGRHRQFVPSKFQNVVDDLQPAWDHFQKFAYLREQPLPETYAIEFGNDRSREVQNILLNHFGEYLIVMNRVFRGLDAPNFAVSMYNVGAGIANCWENGAQPVFSHSSASQG